MPYSPTLNELLYKLKTDFDVLRLKRQSSSTLREGIISIAEDCTKGSNKHMNDVAAVIPHGMLQ